MYMTGQEFIRELLTGLGYIALYIIIYIVIIRLFKRK